MSQRDIFVQSHDIYFLDLRFSAVILQFKSNHSHGCKICRARNRDSCHSEESHSAITAHDARHNALQDLQGLLQVRCF